MNIIMPAVLGVIVLICIGGAAKVVYDNGVQAERTAQLTKATALVHERDQLNVQVRTATPADICNRLGGKWLPDTNECS